jgi:hypothetical protein
MATIDKLVVELQLQAEQFKSQLQAAEGQIKTMASSMNAANAPVDKLKGKFEGLGKTIAHAFIGYEAIKFLKDSAKEAITNSKSQFILSAALERTAGATKEQSEAIDKQLESLGQLTNHVTSELRPSLAVLTRSTGDTTQAMKLMTLALDISAATGRDQASVTMALAKASTGSLGALNRLVPGIKNTKDWMGKLTEQFKGTAKAAADRDPMTKFQVTLTRLQETVGTTLLPILTQFADWFVQMQPLITSLLPVIMGIAAAFATWKIATMALEGAMMLYNGVVALSTIATEGFTVALASTGIGAIAIAVGLLTAGLMSLNGQMDTAAAPRTATYTNPTTGRSTTLDLNEIHKQADAYAKTITNARRTAILKAMKAEGYNATPDAFGAIYDPAAAAEFSKRFDYKKVYDQAFHDRYKYIADKLKAAGTTALTPIDTTPQEKDAGLTKFLADTNKQIQDLQSDYQKKSLAMVKD